MSFCSDYNSEIITTLSNGKRTGSLVSGPFPGFEAYIIL